VKRKDGQLILNAFSFQLRPAWPSGCVGSGIAHCKSVANPWRDHFFAVLRGKIAVRSRISYFTHK
jgi:hypothetical protein